MEFHYDGLIWLTGKHGIAPLCSVSEFFEKGKNSGKLLTLDNIYKYASDEELEAIVHSIIGRTWEQWKKSGINPNLLKPTDKELHEVAKGLRKPQ